MSAALRACSRRRLRSRPTSSVSRTCLGTERAARPRAARRWSKAASAAGVGSRSISARRRNWASSSGRDAGQGRLAAPDWPKAARLPSAPGRAGGAAPREGRPWRGDCSDASPRSVAASAWRELTRFAVAARAASRRVAWVRARHTAPGRDDGGSGKRSRFRAAQRRRARGRGSAQRPDCPWLRLHSRGCRRNGPSRPRRLVRRQRR